MIEEKTIHPFITYLYTLAENQKRGALADLRRGLSGAPGTVPAMFPHVARWVPENVRGTWTEKVYYLVAALFAYYQSGGSSINRQRLNQGNMGSHCREAARKSPQSESFETRFSALLKAHVEDLPTYLRQMIGLLKSVEVPINWNQLFQDLCHWNAESQSVQRQWANGYWVYQNPATEQDLEPVQQ